MHLMFSRRIICSCLVAIVCASTRAFAEDHGRLFGVLPNYSTVDERPAEDGSRATPAISTRESFKIASLNSFDPVVFPYVGLMTTFNGDHDASYGNRYMRALTDNSVGNFMTSAVVPSLTSEDSRYFRSGEGGVLRRIAYAASRSVVTRTRSGHATFNISEVGGNLAAAGLSNLYHDPADRTASGTMSRWGLQVAGDTLGNELKEFWPDIRAKLHRD